MKNQILTLIIGILIGGIITAAVFLIFRPGGSSRNMPDFGSMESFNGTRERPSGFSRRGNYTIPDENMTSKDEVNEN